LGNPLDEEITKIPREKSKKFVNTLPKRAKKDFKELFPNASSLGYYI